MFREEATSALTLLLELEFENVGFSVGRKTGVSGEKPSEQGENQQKKMNPLRWETRIQRNTLGAGREPTTNSTQFDEKRVLSPLRYHCFPSNIHCSSNKVDNLKFYYFFKNMYLKSLTVARIRPSNMTLHDAP